VLLGAELADDLVGAMYVDQSWPDVTTANLLFRKVPLIHDVSVFRINVTHQASFRFVAYLGSTPPRI
jgi:hypothetical protein